MQPHATQRSILSRFLEDPRTTRLRTSDSVMYSLHVAVLVKRGKILAFANNKNGSRSSGSGYSERSIHAERHVVKRLGNIQELRGADMYIMRISKGGCRLQPSMPCAECQLFLEKCVREYGLRRIYFTA